jgi:23S rRNA (guanine745-N1)-methyltransferase
VREDAGTRRWDRGPLHEQNRDDGRRELRERDTTSSRRSTVLADVVPMLRCPVRDAPLTLDGTRLTCPDGHAFDVARQGYVNLLAGRRPPPGDDAAMVARRDAVLSAGHLAPLTAALVRAVSATALPPGVVVEVGAGTAHHLAAVLDALPGRLGLALDTSTPALRRAARAHRRAAAVGADAWRRWPVADESAAAVLAVFAPRDPAEVARVLAPGGVLVVTAAAPDHLAGLVGPLGLLAVGGEKAARLAESLPAGLDVASQEHVTWTMSLDHTTALALALMGPSGHHHGEAALRPRLASLPDPVEVGGSVTVSRVVRVADPPH